MASLQMDVMLSSGPYTWLQTDGEGSLVTTYAPCSESKKVVAYLDGKVQLLAKIAHHVQPLLVVGASTAYKQAEASISQLALLRSNVTNHAEIRCKDTLPHWGHLKSQYLQMGSTDVFRVRTDTPFL